MKRIYSLTLATGMAAAGMLVGVGPSQAAAPSRDVYEIHDVGLVPGCDYPLQYTTDAKVITTTYTDDSGRVSHERSVYPRWRNVLTNLDTGASVSLSVPGPTFITYHGDGSVTQVGTGPWAFDFNPLTGEPGAFLVHGHFVAEFDTAGNLTDFKFDGGADDMCARLAG